MNIPTIFISNNNYEKVVNEAPSIGEISHEVVMVNHGNDDGVEISIAVMFEAKSEYETDKEHDANEFLELVFQTWV